MTPEQMLRDFLAISGQDMPAYPTLDSRPVDPETWLDILDEEVNELHDAVEAGDLVEIADAVADIVYGAVGVAVGHGLPFDALLSEVHRSNMTKSPVPGKAKLIGKGPGFEPPLIAAILDACSSGEPWAKAADGRYYPQAFLRRGHEREPVR